jgi:mono/diheme cytochrome c family protein
VITVQELPEYLPVGQSTKLEFTIRQHGRTPLNDLSPTVKLARAGPEGFSKGQLFRAVRSQEPGRYAAVVTPQDTGAVEITIDAAWHTARVALLPIRVIRPGQAPASLAALARGRDLFVAKGCATCHMKSDDPRLGERQVVAVGPNLTGRQYPADWLSQKLADPARFRAGTGQGAMMPNLGLADAEIAVVVSYINGQPQDAGATAGR